MVKPLRGQLSGFHDFSLNPFPSKIMALLISNISLVACYHELFCKHPFSSLTIKVFPHESFVVYGTHTSYIHMHTYIIHVYTNIIMYM